MQLQDEEEFFKNIIEIIRADNEMTVIKLVHLVIE